MKNIVLIFLWIISWETFAQQPFSMVVDIYATFKKKDLVLNKVVISRSGLGEYQTSFDTILVKDDQLKYHKSLSEPEFFRLTFFFSNQISKSIAFWASSPYYEIQFDENQTPQLSEHNGNDFTQQLNELKQEITKHKQILEDRLKIVSYKNRSIAVVEREINHLRDSLNVVIESLIDESYEKRVINHPDKPISLYALIQYAERPYEKQRVKNNPQRVKEMLNKLTPEVAALPSAQSLRDKLNIANRLGLGAIFENIQLPDTAGKQHSIVSGKGKYVLIDFWASWCGPCRQEFPALIKIYEKYASKGFDIIGISIDKKEKFWKEAIIDDEINKWTQLIDIDDKAKRAYAIKFIPENYLLDPKGKIIAKNLRGEELLEILERIFK